MWRTLGQLGKTMGKPPLWKVFDKEIHAICAFFAGTCFWFITVREQTMERQKHQGRTRVESFFFFSSPQDTLGTFLGEKNWEPSQHQHLQLLISQILFGVYRTGLLIKQGWCTENIQKNQVSRVDFYLGGVGFAFARWVWHKFLPRRSSWAGFA